jgi:hypothetical protein
VVGLSDSNGRSNTAASPAIAAIVDGQIQHYARYESTVSNSKDRPWAILWHVPALLRDSSIFRTESSAVPAGFDQRLDRIRPLSPT